MCVLATRRSSCTRRCVPPPVELGGIEFLEHIRHIVRFINNASGFVGITVALQRREYSIHASDADPRPATPLAASEGGSRRRRRTGT